jgi:hypothetical protein
MQITDLPEDVRQALLLATEYCLESSSPYAKCAQAYLIALDPAIRAEGLEGARTQLLYILNNLQGWRGPAASAARAVLRRYLESTKTATL